MADQSLAAPRVASEPFIGSSGERVWTVRQIATALSWGRQRVEALFAHCPFFDSGQLPSHLETPAWYTLPVQVVSETDFQELKRRIKEAESGRFVHKGQAYLSPGRTLRELRVSGARPVSRELLGQWQRAERCGCDGGRFGAVRLKLRQKGGGTPEYWYLEEDVLRVKGWLLREAKQKRRTTTSFPDLVRKHREGRGFTRASLATAVGVSASLVQAWEKGRLAPSPKTAARLAAALGVSVGDLRIIRRRRKGRTPPRHLFKGVWRDDAGNMIAYSLPKAAREAGLTYERLLCWVKKGLPGPFRHLFPGGQVPVEHRLVPGTQTDWERSISPSDLETLQQGIEKVQRDGQLVTDRVASHEFCDRQGVTRKADRILVNAMLRTLAENGLLSAERVVRADPKGPGIKYPRCYDEAELDQLLAGRDLAEVARAFALEPIKEPPQQADARTGARRRNKRPAEEKHARWKIMRESGLTYGQIVQKHRDDTGEVVTREAIMNAIRRLSEDDEGGSSRC